MRIYWMEKFHIEIPYDKFYIDIVNTMKIYKMKKEK